MKNEDFIKTQMKREKEKADLESERLERVALVKNTLNDFKNEEGKISLKIPEGKRFDLDKIKMQVNKEKMESMTVTLREEGDEVLLNVSHLVEKDGSIVCKNSDKHIEELIELIIKDGQNTIVEGMIHTLENEYGAFTSDLQAIRNSKDYIEETKTVEQDTVGVNLVRDIKGIKKTPGSEVVSLYSKINNLSRKPEISDRLKNLPGMTVPKGLR